MDKPLLEVCAGSYASCMAAARGGADRLELCANLVIGGTTPSPALARQVLRDCRLPVNVLIRPRFGDFLYDEAEMEQMVLEIKAFRALGVNGVVIGALTPDGCLDLEKMKRLMDAAGDLEITLHRAFDMTRDPFQSLEEAVALGCKTILTSGQAPSAPEGAALLKELNARAAGRITIMAGSGVKSGNLPALHEATGILAFHASARKKGLDSGMRYRKQEVSMGLPSLSEYEVWQTDEKEVRACAEIIHTLA